MHRSRNTATDCPRPAEGLAGGKGKRDAERHQESRIQFVHHGTPTHSQHQRILGWGFRARQGIINEWLRRNLNGCKARTRMCCLVQAGGLHLRSDYVPFWHKADLGAALVKQTSGLEYSMSDLPSTAGLNRPMTALPQDAVSAYTGRVS